MVYGKGFFLENMNGLWKRILLIEYEWFLDKMILLREYEWFMEKDSS